MVAQGRKLNPWAGEPVIQRSDHDSLQRTSFAFSSNPPDPAKKAKIGNRFAREARGWKEKKKNDSKIISEI